MDVTFETKYGGGRSGKDEWLTPPELIKKLGEFDLDPCSPINRPWALPMQLRRHMEENGLVPN